eukprot:CAMPEP_0194293186 /NCGR_PEP_ID=MMETSP0169-20130528/47350_1 /TAXON_ID=218684 /ORGANISM="Corethron pennatum, Strain L29A3" /LENGTH=40 /DNA_ID= /DNA_START= /DNA_END= /DNA_ORIENTATION=
MGGPPIHAALAGFAKAAVAPPDVITAPEIHSRRPIGGESP